MDDVKDNNDNVEPQAENDTAEQNSQPAEQTSETPETKPSESDAVKTEEAPKPDNNRGDLNIALKQERERTRELRRQLAERQATERQQNLDPNDYEQWISNPMSQELLIKVAKQELTDYAREITENNPQLHPQVKKAILTNARGFVNETTTDVETAKLDLQDYIEKLVEDTPQTQPEQPQPKGFKVANTNASQADANRNADAAKVQAILDKPVNEWTDDDEAIVAEFEKSKSK